MVWWWSGVMRSYTRTINLDPFSTFACIAFGCCSCRCSLYIFFNNHHRHSSFWASYGNSYLLSIWSLSPLIRIFKNPTEPIFSPQCKLGSRCGIKQWSKKKIRVFVCVRSFWNILLLRERERVCGNVVNVCECLNRLHICAISNAHMAFSDLIYGNTATRTILLSICLDFFPCARVNHQTPR